MVDINSATLAARIMNCLQTILELEPMLRAVDSGSLLSPEFKMLKAFLRHLDAVSLDEDDVTRIETATERFLQELKTPVSLTSPGATKNVPLQ